MNRIPVLNEEARADYGAPTTDVNKQQKKAAPIYGAPKAATTPPAAKAKAKK